MVLCTVSEELSVPRFMKGSGRGWVTAEYSMLPGSTGERSGREGKEMIVCDLTGVGAQDAAIAELAWTKLGTPASTPVPAG